MSVKKERISEPSLVILRDIIQSQQKKIAKLEEMNKALLQAAKDICDKWVNPKMYANAMSEIEAIKNLTEHEKTKMKRLLNDEIDCYLEYMKHKKVDRTKKQVGEKTNDY